MKIGLITITRRENYGNRLQNYAMQTILEKMGNNVETIQKIEDYIPIKEIIKLQIKKTINFKYGKLQRRKLSFVKFNRRYIKFSKRHIFENEKDIALDRAYDLFVCGSDQIWNPNFDFITDSYYLSFTNKKKVAVSASFGIDKIDNLEKFNHSSELIKKIDSISVREKTGAQIINNVIGEKATVLLDPTFMLNPNEWELIEKKPKLKNIDGKYIVCYLLGEYDKNIIDKIKEYARQESCSIIFMENDYNFLDITSMEEFQLNPSEFIWLIHNSEKVITDSFHAVVFSLLFRKRFITIKRNDISGDMSSRFSQLEDIFCIKNIVSNDYNFSNDAIVDYDLFNRVLKIEKEKFENYLYENIR